MFVEYSFELIALLSAVGLIAGLIDAIAGGGGLLTIPALMTAGLPPHIALGTNKLAASFGSATASFTFYKKALFVPKFWLNAMLATFIGSVIGTFAVSYVDASWLEKYIPIFILCFAVYSMLQKRVDIQGDEHPTINHRNKKKQKIQGSLLGFYDGFLGPGTGSFWTISTMSLYRINILMATGVAKTMNFISNFLSLVVFIYLGMIHWEIGIFMGISIMIGSWIGAHMAIRLGSDMIRPVFISCVIAMSGYLIYESWF